MNRGTADTQHRIFRNSKKTAHIHVHAVFTSY